MRTGTRASAAASRPRAPAFELWACTMSGRSRRQSRTSSSSASTSCHGLIARRMCSRWTKGTPAARAASRNGPEPCAATVTSNSPVSPGSRSETEVWAPPASASVIRISSRGFSDIPVQVSTRECPRQESNLRTRFRKPLLYPLSYGGKCGQISAARTGFARLRSGSLSDRRRRGLAGEPWVPPRSNRCSIH